jgi:hypothetical protein
MTQEQQIVKMTTAIRQAIKVMGDRFGSTETHVARAQELKVSMQASPEPSSYVETGPRPDSRSPKNAEVVVET